MLVEHRFAQPCISKNIFEHFIVFIEFGIDNPLLANIQNANYEDGAM